VGVHQFIDAMLAEGHPPRERERFLAGLAEVDARARQTCGRDFLQCGTREQRSLLEQLDRESSPPDPLSLRERGNASRPPSPERRGGQGVRTKGGTRDEPPVPFFRIMKELTLLGYYTSEVGATRELRHAPVPGRFEGCVPLAQIARTWAV
jgi:glucoside 3-dehydrogenase (cytochrome c) hitch-hiker subunit